MCGDLCAGRVDLSPDITISCVEIKLVAKRNSVRRKRLELFGLICLVISPVADSVIEIRQLPSLDKDYIIFP